MYIASSAIDFLNGWFQALSCRNSRYSKNHVKSSDADDGREYLTDHNRREGRKNEILEKSRRNRGQRATLLADISLSAVVTSGSQGTKLVPRPR